MFKFKYILLVFSLTFDLFYPYWSVAARLEIENIPRINKLKINRRTESANFDHEILLTGSDFIQLKIPVSNSTQHLWRNKASDVGHVFIFYDGSGIRGTDVLNIDFLISILPMIKTVDGNNFLLWLEMLDYDYRREILKVIEGIPVEGGEGSPELIDKLQHFRYIEKHMSDLNQNYVRINSGQFILDLGIMDEAKASTYALTKKMLHKSIISLGQNFMNNNTQLQLWKSNTQLEVRDNYDWAGIGLGGISSILDLVNGIMEGDLASFGVGISTLFVDILTQVVGFKVVEEFLKTLVATSAEAFKTLVNNLDKVLGGVSGLIGAGFAIYNIVNDIKTFAGGNLSGLDIAITTISLISNVVSLVLSVASVVLTIIGSALASVLGPIGAVIGILFTVIGMILRHFSKKNAANDHVRRLNSLIRLTDEEKNREYHNNYDGKDTSQYILDLANQKYGNNKLVEVALEFLRDSPDVETYVMPALNQKDDSSGSTPNFYLNNEVYFNTPKTYVQLERWAPDQSASVICCPMQLQNHIECAPEADNWEPVAGTMYAHKCKFALAIREWRLRESDITLFDLKKGNDIGYGRLENTNFFLVEDGSKSFYGGNKNDIFLLQSNLVTGVLNGMGGNNTLQIVADNVTTTYVTVDLHNGVFDYGNSNTNQFILENIHIVSGRAGKSDIIYPSCDTYYISGGGGSTSANKDQIFINQQTTCKYSSLFIDIQGYTEVQNESPTGEFIYRIQNGSSIVLDINYEHEIMEPGEIVQSHIILLEHDLEDIRMATFNSETREFFIESTWTNLLLDFTFRTSELNETSMFHDKPIILTKDNNTMKAKGAGIVVSIINITTERESVSAMPFGETIIILGAHVNEVRGGLGNDTFVIAADSFSGSIIGGPGLGNNLVLDNDIHLNSQLTVNFMDQTINTPSTTITFNNLNQFTGRSEQVENVIVECSKDTYVINAQGGKSPTEVDTVHIPFCMENQINSTIIIQINKFTRIDNDAGFGQFVYLVPMESNMAFNFLYLGDEYRNSHIIQFLFDAQNIYSGYITNDYTTVVFADATDVEINIPSIRPILTNQSVDTGEIEYLVTPTILTQDNAIVKITPANEFHFIWNVTALSDREEMNQLIGSTFGHNFYFVHRHIDTLTGGNNDDIFYLYNESFHGTLDGGLGKDSIILSEEYFSNTIVKLNLDTEGSSSDMKFISIEQVTGRYQNADHIDVGCSVDFVNGREGVRGNPDIITIRPNSLCNYNLHTIIHPNTQLLNFAESGNFIYTLNNTGTFEFIENPNINHTALLQLEQSNISNVTFDSENGMLTFHNLLNESVTTIKVFSFDQNSTYYEQPRIVSKDLIQFQVSQEDGNIFGVFPLMETKENRYENYTGFSFINNIFLVGGNGDKSVEGGEFDDVFILLNSSISASLQGSGGKNTLVISDLAAIDSEQYIQIRSTRVHNEQNGDYMDILGSTIRSSNFSVVIGSNVTNEVIFADCDIEMIDVKGGIDMIILESTPNCNYTTVNLLIYDSTTVENNAPNGTFFYNVLDENINFGITCHECKNGSHTFGLSFDTNSMQVLAVNGSDGCNIKIRHDEIDTVYMIDNVGENATCIYPMFLTSDLLRIDISRIGTKNGLYQADSWDTEDSSFIDDWKHKATLLNMTIKIIVNETNDLITIGRPGFDILWSSPSHVSHMYGNGGANIFVIGANIQDNITTTFSEVNLYTEENSEDVIDLSLLVKPIRLRSNGTGDENELPGKYFVPELLSLENEKLLIIVQENSELEPVNVVLHNSGRWINRTKVVLSQTSMSIQLDPENSNDYLFVPIPVNLTTQTYIYIDEENFEENTKILLGRGLGEDMATTVMAMESDLVVTNVFDASAPSEFVTVVFNEFIDNRVKSKEWMPEIPSNVHLDFLGGKTVTLEEVDITQLSDIVQVLIGEKEKLEFEVFGFSCTQEGRFPDPRRCEIYHDCRALNNKEAKEFVHYEFECPTGTIYCKIEQSCGYESVVLCPCDRISKYT